MPKCEITVVANSDMELLTRKTVLDHVNALSTEQIKRVLKMLKSPKAIAAISSDVKFALLQKFL